VSSPDPDEHARPITTAPSRLRSRPVLVLAVLIGLLLVRLAVGVISTEQQFKDAMQNVTAGHGLAETGRFLESGDVRSMYREPLPIAAIAVHLVIDPRLRGVTLAELDRDGAAIRALKQQNLLWAALLLAGVAVQSWRLASPRSRLAVAAAAVVLVHAVLIETVADRMLSELHAAVFLVWAGILGQQWIRDHRRRDALLLGMVIGLGALTKASLLYIGVVYLCLLAVLPLLASRRRRTAPRSALRLLGVSLAGLAMLALPWMARNAAAFDTWSIADRGGLSLWYRAAYEDATPAELRGSWYAFTPLPLQPAAGYLLGVTDADLDGPLRRAHRFHPDEDVEQLSFYELARADRRRLTDAYLEAGVQDRARARVLADKDLRSAGLEVLRRDPGMFVTTTPMFLWRGTWAVKAAPLVPRPVLGVINPLGMMVLLVAGISAVVRRRPGRFAVVGLPTGVVLFSALLTMYEPRFTEVALPTMSILLVLAAARLVERRRPS